jgi:hypothetical protein
MTKMSGVELDLCSEPVIAHADGTAECLAEGCTLAPHLHDVVAACSALDPACLCVEGAPRAWAECDLVAA